MSVSPQSVLDQMRKALLLQRDGKPARAKPIYERILRQDPANAEATNLLALCALEMGYPKRAASLLERAVTIAPGEARYHLNLADCLEQVGELSAALQALEQGLGALPGEPALLRARARLLRRLDRPDEALAAYDAAVRAAPEDLDLLAEFGQLLLLRSSHEQAEKVYRFVLAADPAHRLAVLGLADALNQLDRPAEARDLLTASSTAFDTARDAEYQLHLANAHWGAGSFTAALAALDRVHALGHRSADSHLLRGKALYHLGRFAEARGELEAALAIDPDRHDATMTLGFCCLSMGDLARGWELAEHRFDMQAKGVIRRQFQAPAWRGEPLDGKTLMVWDDQGIGDVLRTSSMFAELAERAGKLIVECHPKAVALLARNFPRIEVRARRHESLGKLFGAETFDCHCAFGTLPMYLRPTIASFPKRRGFLVADPARLAELRQRPPLDGDRPRIGLSWTSGNRSGLRGHSYLTLADLLPVLTIPGIEFVLLDYTDRSAEIAALRAEHDFTLHRWNDLDLFDDLETVAALTSCMDLVISANTSVADMAGALGIPTWRFGPATGVVLLGEENPPWNPATRYLRLQPESPARDIVPSLEASLRGWLKTFSRGS